MSIENTIEELKARTPGGFGVTVETLTPTEQDIRVLSAQLGRKVRDVIEIPARCVCGNPLVAATAPRLSNGTPFPTVFYLAHPVITAAASRLEAGGLMYEMTRWLRTRTWRHSTLPRTRTTWLSVSASA